MEELSLGSPHYMAPELCSRSPYNNKVDVWAVGVICYELLCNRRPFKDSMKIKGQGKQGIFNDIIVNEPDYSGMQQFSHEAMEFVKSALTKNASARSSIAELLESSWMRNFE